VLFHVWHDGRIESMHWLSDAGLLVFTGVNGEAYWEQRGYFGTSSAHPLVVFAIRPTRGRIERGWLRAPGAEGAMNAEWYKCLSPVAHRNPFSMRLTLQQTGFSGRGLGEIGLDVRIELPDELHRIRWAINEYGERIPNSLIVHDTFNRWPEAPDPADFYLVDLPPILPEWRGIAGPGLPGTFVGDAAPPEGE